MAKAPRAQRPVLKPAPAPTAPQAPTAIIPAVVEHRPAADQAASESGDAPVAPASEIPATDASAETPPAPADGEQPPATPEISPDDGRVWMKMKTGLCGPDFSLSPGDQYPFDADEAERLEKAGFAEPIA